MEDKIEINGEVYLRQSKPANRKIVRTYSAGVFFGEVESRSGKECVMRAARNLWKWDGASSLHELAVRGVARPGGCKFPCAVDKIELTEVIEILDVTEAAARSIDAVEEWSQHE